MSEKKNKEYRSLRVPEETFQQAKFIADKSGKTISATVTEIINAVFNVSCNFSALNLSYDYCITENKVTIQVEGSSNLVVSEIKSPDAKNEANFSPILKVKFKDTKGYVSIPKKVGEKNE